MKPQPSAQLIIVGAGGVWPGSLLEDNPEVVVLAEGIDGPRVLLARTLRTLAAASAAGRPMRQVALAASSDTSQAAVRARAELVRAVARQLSATGGGEILFAVDPRSQDAGSRSLALLEPLLAELAGTSVSLKMRFVTDAVGRHRVARGEPRMARAS